MGGEAAHGSVPCDVERRPIRAVHQRGASARRHVRRHPRHAKTAVPVWTCNPCYLDRRPHFLLSTRRSPRVRRRSHRSTNSMRVQITVNVSRTGVTSVIWCLCSRRCRRATNASFRERSGHQRDEDAYLSTIELRVLAPSALGGFKRLYELIEDRRVIEQMEFCLRMAGSQF